MSYDAPVSVVIRPTGFKCLRPYQYEFENEVRMRPCNSPDCRHCNARAKRDYSGRAAGEAYTSAQCVAVTLTYREGEKGAYTFMAQDYSAALKRLRQAMFRQGAKLAGVSAHTERIRDPLERAERKALIDAHTPRITFIGCGERGSTSTMRCHWHLLLFFDRGSSGLVSTPRQADGRQGRELVAWWPHGTVCIDVLPNDMGSKMKAARYCVKYMDKSRGVDPLKPHGPNMPAYEAERRQREADCPWRRRNDGTKAAFVPKAVAMRRRNEADARFIYSQGKALGSEYLRRRALQHVDAGLPLSPFFEVPGVRFARGAGDLVKHFVFGRSRARYVEEYEKAWEERYPGRHVPQNDFVKRHGSGGPLAKAKPLFKRGERPEPKPPLPVLNFRKDRSGIIEILTGGRRLGFVHLSKTGFATFERSSDGRLFKVPNGHLRDLVDMDEAAHLAVEARISELRGPDWMTPREYRIEKAKRHLAQRDAILSFSIGSPKATPAHVAGIEPPNGLERKLRLNGAGFIPGTVTGRVVDGVVVRAPTQELRMVPEYRGGFPTGRMVPRYMWKRP